MRTEYSKSNTKETFVFLQRFGYRSKHLVKKEVNNAGKGKLPLLNEGAIKSVPILL